MKLISIILIFMLTSCCQAQDDIDYNSLYFNPGYKVQQYLQEPPPDPPTQEFGERPSMFEDPEPDNFSPSGILKCWAYTTACRSPYE